jgi:hypothetical protein
MGSSFVIRVEMTFPNPAAAKAFADQNLTRLPRKPREPFQGELPGRPVSETLTEWGNLGDVTLTIRASRWHLTALMGEDAFNDLAPELAALVHAGGRLGAKAEAVACGIEFEDGYNLTFTEKDGLKIQRLTMAEAAAIQQQPWFRKAFRG